MEAERIEVSMDVEGLAPDRISDVRVLMDGVVAGYEVAVGPWVGAGPPCKADFEVIGIWRSIIIVTRSVGFFIDLTATSCLSLIIFTPLTSNNLSPTRRPDNSADPPGVNLETNKPRSFSMYGVDSTPPAMVNPNPLEL